jgi:hypothetical protein
VAEGPRRPEAAVVVVAEAAAPAEVAAVAALPLAAVRAQALRQERPQEQLWSRRLRK